ncbi:MAG: preQ(1) synthase [Chloroflexi bacterium]|nr:preQ(1) synthase [Chloroflexota bacterium]
MTGDEVTALCPVTGQPDWYTVTIRYVPRERCIESKSLKLYFQTYRNAGVFCEALAAQIADEVLRVVEPASVEVSVHQKPRGGISIDATARRTMSANSPG